MLILTPFQVTSPICNTCRENPRVVEWETCQLVSWRSPVRTPQQSQARTGAHAHGPHRPAPTGPHRPALRRPQAHRPAGPQSHMVKRPAPHWGARRPTGQQAHSRTWSKGQQPNPTHQKVAAYMDKEMLILTPEVLILTLRWIIDDILKDLMYFWHDHMSEVLILTFLHDSHRKLTKIAKT